MKHAQNSGWNPYCALQNKITQQFVTRKFLTINFADRKFFIFDLNLGSSWKNLESSRSIMQNFFCQESRTVILKMFIF